MQESKVRQKRFCLHPRAAVKALVQRNERRVSTEMVSALRSTTAPLRAGIRMMSQWSGSLDTPGMSMIKATSTGLQRTRKPFLNI